MNKKGSKASKEVSSYEIRDIVLGKVRGFPPWPGQVVDPSSAPEGVLKERPSNKKTVFYCVQFFPAGDYAWLLPKDISKLQQHEIEAYINEPYKRSGDLLEGYRIARNPKDWEESLAAAAVEEDNDNEVDQLESGGEAGDEEDEEGGKKKSSTVRKRKRESDAGTTKSVRKKTGGAKMKKEVGEGTVRKKGGAGNAAGAKGRKSASSGKSKAAVESEDEGEQDDADGVNGQEGGPSKRTSPPPAKKVKRDTEDPIENDPEALKVRDWRHKLQKIFLSNKQGMPKESDMPGMDELFTQIEQYDKINIQYLSFSKIGKVMRHIVGLTDERVPRDDEFKFRERAKVLVDKWHQILNANKTTNNNNNNVTATSTAAAISSANGTTTGANSANANAASTKVTTNGATTKDEGLAKTESTLVAEKTAQLDLNGEAPTASTDDMKVDDGLKPEDAGAAEPAVDIPVTELGDVSALGDITMSEMAD